MGETTSTKFDIEVCASVHQFQRRYCWMLSSILQQENFDVSRIRVCGAYIKGTGNPTTADVLDFFASQGLSVHHVPYEDKSLFQYRGEVRNRHVSELEAPWVLFADCDMVFPPNFFAELMGTLRRRRFRNSNKCMFTGRYSTVLETTEAVVDSDPDRYPCVVPDAWGQITQLPAVRKANVGAGFCHITRTAFIRDERGYYVPPGKAADWNWDRKHSRCKSDTQYRRDVGKQKLPIPWLYHIQHQRDKEHGKHIELQR